MDISRVRKLLRTHPTRVPVVCWRGSRRGGDDYKKLLMPKEFHIQEFVVKVKEHVPWAQDRSEVKCIPHDILLSGDNETAHLTVKELYDTYALGDLCLHLEVSLGDVKEELSEPDEPILNFIPDPTLDALRATFGEHTATNGMLTPPGPLAPIPAMPPYHLYGLGPAPATPPAPPTPTELGPVPLTPPDLAPCRSAPVTPVGIPVFTGPGPVPLTPPDLAPILG
ncbi:hypothetical protein AK812_SmicGene27931 [Symbiodinium microadriaticum]|uniref:Uncharacterized protein n=1 Tax=Symbiodinium microadriaticum TaxID=2951 RepID=A0A1Q9D5Q7_SYMMI|nr:hypothetical protein AK812_SmicGene27931 [Symbiodinium microadriaticum]